ncbi:hypothetical protein PMAYCL1PPCAC_08592, partial [Pristionchus mayeri]
FQSTCDSTVLKALAFDRSIMYKADCAFLYIQMELCTSDLESWLTDASNNPRDLAQIKNWFKQIVSAVGYIHDNGKIHRDLKPSNILFAGPEKLKICDLGIAADISTKNGKEITATRTGRAGTLQYMAPEQHGFSYTSKVDIFSLGFILAELCIPMNAARTAQVFSDLRAGKHINLLKEQPEVERLVVSMTNSSHLKRPKCEEILKNPWLA